MPVYFLVLFSIIVTLFVCIPNFGQEVIRIFNYVLIVKEEITVLFKKKCYFYLVRQKVSWWEFFSKWACCQIRKIVGWACAGNAGNVCASRHVRDRFLCSRGGGGGGGKHFRHSRCMRNPQLYVSGKRPMKSGCNVFCMPNTVTMSSVCIWYHNGRRH